VPTVPKATRDLVKSRAKHRCEYCRIPEAEFVAAVGFQVEHVTPRKILRARGLQLFDPKYLAFSCPRCNSFKGTQTHGTDPQSRLQCPLYDPRSQRWHHEFLPMPSGHILGKTPVGRTTKDALKLNTLADVLLNRARLHACQKWP